jgi:hypothetical protein
VTTWGPADGVRRIDRLDLAVDQPVKEMAKRGEPLLYPVLEGEEWRKLLDGIPTTALRDQRDRKHQHRALNDCRIGRACGCGARSNPNAHSRGQKPRQARVRHVSAGEQTSSPHPAA